MELTIGKFNYKTGRLNAFQQIHVIRRLAPAFWAMGSAVLSSGTDTAKLSVADMLGAFGPLAQAISKMEDKDVDYVLKACLGVCMRDSGADGKALWAPVQAPNGALMFDDLDMMDLMQLARTVIQENLGNFLTAPPGSQGATAETRA